MKIFMTGATGFVGGHLRRALLARGHQLRLLIHGRTGELAAGEEMVPGDVRKLETFRDAAIGCDAAINLVGIIREFPARGVTFEALHQEATRNALTAAQTAGISRFLQMSANGTRANAVAGYHRSKWAAEELVRNSGLAWTIFRPSLIFGPKDAFVNMLAGYIRTFPAVPVIGDGLYQMQPISADDVASCFALALERPETIGQTYTLCGPDRLTYRELLDAIGRALGQNRVIKVPQPLGLMKLIVPFMEQIDAFPLTVDQLTMLTEGNIGDDSWQQVFGIVPQRFEEGIRRYLAP
jgi:NADH dehydrogenase